VTTVGPLVDQKSDRILPAWKSEISKERHNERATNSKEQHNKRATYWGYG